MFAPKRKYSRELSIDKETLIQRSLTSKKLIHYEAEPYVNAFKSCQKDELFIMRFYDNSFKLSENCGFGGIFEVIGIVEITQHFKSQCSLKIKLQMGIFSVNFPKILILILLFLGIILIPITTAFLFLILIICFFLSIWWFINYIKVKSFLKIISSAIEIDNIWN
jgi:hypothetical protein